MSKFVKRLAVVFFGLLIVLTLTACGSQPYVQDVFLSVNHRVFAEHSHSPGSPEWSPSDFQLYVLMSDGNVGQVPLAIANIGLEPIAEYIFQFTISFTAENGHTFLESFIGFIEGKVTADQIAAIDETQHPNLLAPSLILAYGIGQTDAYFAQRVDAVRDLVAPLIANRPILGENFALIQLDFDDDGFIYQNIHARSDLALLADDFAINGLETPSSGHITRNTDVIVALGDDYNVGATIRTYTRRPGNNNDSPIITETAGFWDYVFIIPIAWLISLFGGWMGQSFALGILFGTVIIRTLAWPIYAKSNDAQLKMQLAQPELQRIQAKYAGKSDPASKQRQQQETMQAYKKHGISILGCLTPLIQMPIFIAMFQTVHRITVPGGMFADRVSNHMFLGIIDLSRGGFGDWGAIVLSLIVGVTMFFLNRLSSRKPAYLKKTATHAVKATQAVQTERTMKIVMYVMIIFMVFASINSAALAFYWVVGNVFSIGQTLLVRKLNEKKFYKKQNEAYGIIDAKPAKKDKTKKNKNNQNNNSNILEMSSSNTTTNKKKNNNTSSNNQNANRPNNSNKNKRKRG